MTRQNKLLFKILLASILIFALSLAFSKKERSAHKSIESAILNPSYKNEVNLIEIETREGSSITLKRHGDFWLLSNTFENGNEICTIADSKIISSLLENAGKIRNIYRISDKESDYNSLGLGKNTETCITISQNNIKMYTKVHFGHSDSFTNRIYFRSEASNIVYETQNDFHQYLTSEPNYWSEGTITPEITNPVQFSLKTNEEFIQESSNTKALDEKSPEFTSKSNTLLSLRHGQIWPESTINSANIISTLSIQDGSGRLAEVKFFKMQIGDNESYFYKKSIQASPVDSQENIFAFYSENAVYEISAWTYERIKSIFTQKN